MSEIPEAFKCMQAGCIYKTTKYACYLDHFRKSHKSLYEATRISFNVCDQQPHFESAPSAEQYQEKLQKSSESRSNLPFKVDYQMDTDYADLLQRDVDLESIRQKVAQEQMMRKRNYNSAPKVIDEITANVCDNLLQLHADYPEHNIRDLIDEAKSIYSSAYLQRKMTNSLQFKRKPVTYFSKSQNSIVTRDICSVSVIDTLKELFKNKDIVDLVRKDHACK